VEGDVLKGYVWCVVIESDGRRKDGVVCWDGLVERRSWRAAGRSSVGVDMVVVCTIDSYLDVIKTLLLPNKISRLLEFQRVTVLAWQFPSNFLQSRVILFTGHDSPPNTSSLLANSTL